MAMQVPAPLISPEDTERDARPDIARVTRSLSKANRELLAFFRKTIRIEVGEGCRPVLAVVSADLSFEPLDILFLLHFGALELHVDGADRVYLVTTDFNDKLANEGPVCAPKRPYRRKKIKTGAGR